MSRCHCACTCIPGDATGYNPVQIGQLWRIIANQFRVHKCTVKKFVYLFCFNGTVSVITHDLIRVSLIEEACSIVHQLETVK